MIVVLEKSVIAEKGEFAELKQPGSIFEQLFGCYLKEV